MKKYGPIILMLALALPMLAMLYKGGKVNEISPADFKAAIARPGVVVLDVRMPKEYAEGHIQGAKLMNVFDDDFNDRLAKLDKGKSYAVYCLSGGRSWEAAETMAGMGFTDVVALKGGAMAWKKAGYKLVKD